MTSYLEYPPNEDEDATQYARRLESDGRDEMFIRQALMAHIGFKLAELGEFLEPFPAARLRHLASLVRIRPNRSRYSLEVYVARSLGISRERAVYWVALLGEPCAMDFDRSKRVCE